MKMMNNVFVCLSSIAVGISPTPFDEVIPKDPHQTYIQRVTPHRSPQVEGSPISNN